MSYLHSTELFGVVVVESRDALHMLLPTTSSGITMKLFEEDARGMAGGRGSTLRCPCVEELLFQA